MSMSTTTGTPTMSQETLWAQDGRSTYGKPWSRVRAIREALGWAVWTERVRNQMERISTLLEDNGTHVCMGGPGVQRWCWVCHYSKQIDQQVKEWDRIAEAPPIPSTAQLRNAMDRPCKEHRAVMIYRRLHRRRWDRIAAVKATVKTFKTEKAQSKHWDAALASDRGMARIDRALARLERLAKGAPWMTQSLGWIAGGSKYPK